MASYGFVDEMDGCFLTGWAVSGVEFKDCEIRIFDNSLHLIAVGFAQKPRPDLYVLGRGRSNFGFRIFIPFNLVSSSVLHVYADGVELSGSPFSIGSGQYDGRIHFDGSCITGWVRERVEQYGELDVSLFDDLGNMIGKPICNRQKYNADIFGSKTRFSLELDRKYLISGNLSVIAQVKSKIFASCQGRLSMIGQIECLTPYECCGWLLCEQDPKKTFQIELCKNGISICFMEAGGGIEQIEYDGEMKFVNRFKCSYFIASKDAIEQEKISIRFKGTDVELFGGPFLVSLNETKSCHPIWRSSDLSEDF
jgi:hypothetical protein